VTLCYWEGNRGSASHGPCGTDFTHGLKTYERKMSVLPEIYHEYGTLTFPFATRAIAE